MGTPEPTSWPQGEVEPSASARIGTRRSSRTLTDGHRRPRGAPSHGAGHTAPNRKLPRHWRAHVHILKQLIVGQARRTQESQDRIALTHSVDDTILDQLYLRAEASSTSLPPRSDLRSATEAQEWLADMRQNMRANFASGDHAILRVNESEFLSRSGLTVAVVPTSGPSFVIGSSGITITGSGTHEQAWLPVAPDAVIGLSPRPSEAGVRVVGNDFVEERNQAAVAASDRIAGPSRAVITKLLAEAE